MNNHKPWFICIFMFGCCCAWIFPSIFHLMRVHAQYSTQCSTFSVAFDECGDNETCGLGEYAISAAFETGVGIMAVAYATVPCQGTTCTSISNVPTATNNGGYCCDRDNDTYVGVNRPGCPAGTDCDDNNMGIHPNATEVCDGVDNNCANGIDENAVCCYGDGSDAYCLALKGSCGFYQDWNDGGICKPLSCMGCYIGGGYWCDQTGYCWTPIIIDIDGDGFALTGAANGVWFKPSPGATQIRTAWTSRNDDDSLLVLDINANGSIDDGSELFGCSSPQPVPPQGQIGNGFIALAEHDKSSNGGNNDGQIDFRDQVFSRLKLWRDRNHDGLSEASELKRLINTDVRVIELNYHESRREDVHGNKFKYRARVRDVQGGQVGRWAWDVFPRVAH